MTSPTQTDAPVVSTQAGPVRGHATGGIASFKGIPYAGRIEGLNRFLRPQPIEGWSGELDASRFGPSAPRFIPSVPDWTMPKAGAAMSRMLGGMTDPGPDCLSLNVWAPQSDVTDADRQLKPVVFWIHGGGLASGGSSQPSADGAFLSQRGDLVVVSANYRLGGTGFLAADGLFADDVCVGNRGFMDLAAALEWVQRNIANFGGDPRNVTLIGQSAGGTCVWGLLAAPSTEGLFHRAVVMSGPIVMIDIDDHHRFTRDVLKEMKVDAGDVDALAKAPDDVIVGTKMQSMLYRRGQPYGEMSRIRLPAAGAYGTEFMPDDVLVAMTNARARKVDLLIGNCGHDGRVAVVPMPLPKSIAIRIGNSMFTGLFGATKADRKALLAAYRAALPDADSYTIQERMQSDALYRTRSIRAAETHSRSGGRTFMYHFAYEARGLRGVFGAFHGFDAAFMFGNLSALGECLGNDEDVAEAETLSAHITDAWAAFAHTGTPSASGLPDWPAYDTDTRQTMILNTRSEVVTDPDQRIREIWAERVA